MDYNGCRNIYWKYAKKIGLHTCVYCNVQFADVFTDRHGTIKSNSTIDHYKSKVKKPYLCISFFNFMPACSHCNQVKNKYDIPFYLYQTEEGQTEEVKFSLESTSVMEYFRTFNAEDLELDLKESNADHDEDYLKRLSLRQIYGEHKDVAEEVLWRSIVYNESQQEALKKQFGLLLDNVDFERFVLGTYAQPEDVYKRPLTKMRQDLWKEAQSNFLEHLLVVSRGLK